MCLATGVELARKTLEKRGWPKKGGQQVSLFPPSLSLSPPLLLKTYSPLDSSLNFLKTLLVAGHPQHRAFPLQHQHRSPTSFARHGPVCHEGYPDRVRLHDHPGYAHRLHQDRGTLAFPPAPPFRASEAAD